MNTREELLSLLRSSQGTWVSGDELARKVALTRSAVWKHVRKLREEGCAIESSPRKGYLLTETPDLLSADEIRMALTTRTFGRGEIVCLERTESTNTTAKAMALSGAPEGTLILAEAQTAGRGRKGRNWFSPLREGVYVSIVLRPRLLLNQAGRIPILASLALAETIVSLELPNVSIKWPNDVLLSGKKIGGILTEIGAEMDTLDYMIVGVGINVNTHRFPRTLQDSATSLFLGSGMRVLRSVVLVRFLTHFERYYGSYGQGIAGRVLATWKKFAGITGKRVFVEAESGGSEGVLQDLDEDGALVVLAPDGRRVRVSSGEVRLRV
jgi:BirA family transcriptional regulator, biotin operon repressor / biotin---[acetyl-CoA-carboxylase] ligase